MIPLKRILLVEDKIADVEMTLAALEKAKVANEVVVARDGVEALDYLYCRGKFSDRPQGLPAVILLDNQMPRVSGTEVLRVIKSDTLLNSIPIILLASSHDEPYLKQSYKLGVVSHVIKPVDFRQFAAAIKRVGAFWAILNDPLQPTLKA